MEIAADDTKDNCSMGNTAGFCVTPTCFTLLLFPKQVVAFVRGRDD